MELPFELQKIPLHVAIIMDGNGRWAKKRALPRIMGHKKGVKAVQDTVEFAREIGIKALTLYAFSKENWQRPQEEVNALMELLIEYLDSQLEKLLKNRIALKTIGETHLLPEKVRDKLNLTIEKTRNNKDMTLVLALSYSSQSEIVRAAKKFAAMCIKKEDIPDSLNEEKFKALLDTSGLPELDLIIRTSGELRLSNFLLYQAAYAELYMTKTMWPDFDKQEFVKALNDYAARERRFGAIS
jgi:undecaprenyl diphosphate synthase